MENIKSYFTSNYQKSFDLISALLVFFLPISTALPNILLIPLALLVIVNFRKIKPIKSKAIFYFGCSPAFIIVLAIFKGSFLADIDSYTKYFSFFLLLFLFGQVKYLKIIEYSFLTGIFVALIGSSIAVGIHTYENPGFLLDSGGIVNDLLWLERPYFGIMLSLGVFICLKNAEKFRRNDYYLLALLFIGFSVYISARLSILLNCLLIFIFLLRSYRIQRGTKIWTGIVLVLLIGVAMGLSDNLMSRMKITNSWEKTTEKIIEYEPRFIIWPCAIEVMQNDWNVFTGLESFEEVEQKLTACYARTIDKEKEGKLNYYLERKFNTHNQFLDFLLIGGILPFIILLLTFFYVWFSRNYTAEMKIVFLIFFAFFLVENAFHRQLGSFLIGIFMVLYRKKEKE